MGVPSFCVDGLLPQSRMKSKPWYCPTGQTRSGNRPQKLHPVSVYIGYNNSISEPWSFPPAPLY